MADGNKPAEQALSVADSSKPAEKVPSVAEEGKKSGKCNKKGKAKSAKRNKKGKTKSAQSNKKDKAKSDQRNKKDNTKSDQRNKKDNTKSPDKRVKELLLKGTELTKEENFEELKKFDDEFKNSVAVFVSNHSLEERKILVDELFKQRESYRRACNSGKLANSNNTKDAKKPDSTSESLPASSKDEAPIQKCPQRKALGTSAYYQTWKFIQARTSYWKSEIYRSKTIRQMATEAFDRWMEAGNILDY